ncbi:MAG: YgfZ/GcvT domain-containing protein [Armatimonadota bacterium]
MSVHWLLERERDWTRVRGRDRTGFLQGMLSNDVAGLGPGQGCYAFQLDSTGHVLADPHVLVFEDHLLLGVEEGAGEGLRERLESYCVMERCVFEAVGAEFSTLSVFGEGTPEWVGSRIVSVDRNASEGTHWNASELVEGAILFKAGPIAWPWYRLVFPRRLEALVADRMAKLGALVADPSEWLRWRISVGMPVHGIDFDSRTLAMESGQVGRAIHFRKGCYIGQEIVARIDARGKVHRTIVPLDTVGADDPGAPLTLSGREVGRITSHIVDAELRTGVGLGIVRAEGIEHRPWLEWGTGRARVRAEATP